LAIVKSVCIAGGGVSVEKTGLRGTVHHAARFHYIRESVEMLIGQGAWDATVVRRSAKKRPSTKLGQVQQGGRRLGQMPRCLLIGELVLTQIGFKAYPKVRAHC